MHHGQNREEAKNTKKNANGGFLNLAKIGGNMQYASLASGGWMPLFVGFCSPSTLIIVRMCLTKEVKPSHLAFRASSMAIIKSPTSSSTA